MSPEDSNFENSRIERLKRALYSRNESMVPKDERSHMPHYESEVQNNWGGPKSFDLRYDEVAKKNNSFFNKFLIISLILFIISLTVAVFVFFGGINLISSSNVDIKVISPSSVSSGEEYLMQLNITNGNRTDLEDVALAIDYPVGSQDVNSSSRSLTHDRIELGSIPKGESKDHSVRALLFGEKDTIKTFILNLEYKVKGSNATLLKEKTVDVSIGSSPILMEIDYPKEVNSGQEMKINVDLTSNSPVTIRNSQVKIEYPFGFTYKSSSIKPTSDNSVWNIGDLKDGEKTTLTVIGVLVGQNMEDRSFRISAGTQGFSQVTNSDLVESSITVGIRKSFFDLKVTTSDDSVKRVGEYIPVTIKWYNTLPDKIINAKIEAVISGNIFDRNKVSVGNLGFYESINNMVNWDKNAVKELIQLMPGAEGQVSVSLLSLTDPQIVRALRNPYIDVHVTMTGARSDEDSSEVSSSADLQIKIQSTLTLVSKSLRSIGPFTNTGPIPPQADKESTYSINWTVTNTTNNLKDAEVVTTLPVGVLWKGEISPTSERVTYDPDTRVVKWKIGNISAGVGFSNSAKEVSFKVGIVPSINQIGASPALITKSTATAIDMYTETEISGTFEQVDTQYSDPNFKSGDNIVKQ
ncbi:MAG: hypothetical protein WAX44_01110 [Minisyncoccia bacterium]